MTSVVSSHQDLECNICCEKYTSFKRAKIKCNACDFECCKLCNETYLLDQLTPSCMSCGKTWTETFCVENMKSFMKGKHKEHVKKILFEVEKSRFPETMPAVENMRNITKWTQLNIEDRNKLLNLKIQQRALEKQYVEREQNIRRALQGAPLLGKSEEEENKYQRACPKNDCEGFLSSQWKCGVCEIWVCKDCFEIKGDTKDTDHTCNPNTLLTAQSLKKETKPCPNCHSAIYKISGCFSPETPILMWNGNIKTACEIKINDELIGIDGEKRTVQDITSGNDTMYKIKQNKADDYTVNSKHTLLLQQKKGGICEMLVEDYIKLKKGEKKQLYGFRSGKCNWKKQDVKIDPYLLGTWLGDGYSDASGFSSNDNEIIKYWMNWVENNNGEVVHVAPYRFSVRRKGSGYSRGAIGDEDNCPVCKKQKCTLCDDKKEYPKHKKPKNATNPLKDLLKIYNLIHNKHIPSEFLVNSRENRLKLLAGIIDTDGHVSKAQNGKRVAIVQVNPILSMQIVLLSRSLGFITHYRIVERKAVKFPNTEKLTDCKDQYQINISGMNLSEIPTIIERNKCANSNPNKNMYRTSISVEAIGMGKYYGFLLDGDHTFVSTDFTGLKNCSQMFCVMCHIAFDWKTGKKTRGHIHNPHYYAWINNGGNDAAIPGAAMPCGGLPAYSILKHAICKINLTSPSHMGSGSAPTSPISEEIIKIFLMKDSVLKGLFSKMNLKIISRHSSITLQNFPNLYDMKTRKLTHTSEACIKVRGMEESMIISNIEKFREQDIASDQFKDFVRANWPSTYEFNMLFRRNTSDPKIDEYMVLPIEVEYVKDIILKMTTRHSSLLHFEHVELDVWRRKVNQNQDNKKLRINFILKNITEKEMKTHLLKNERQSKKARAIFDIYELYARVCADSFRKITTVASDHPLTLQILCEEWDKQEKIRMYCNDELKKFSESFNLITPYIGANGRTNSYFQDSLAYQPISKHYKLLNDSKLQPVQLDKNILKLVGLWYKIARQQIRDVRRQF
ncbi:MAG: hypothetical protein CXT73_04795 [Methanobacteriota archaeon]|nr:MAG: hypothetical protein CXT73_04795 [Euryarchaeota archaeon]